MWSLVEPHFPAHDPPTPRYVVKSPFFAILAYEFRFCEISHRNHPKWVVSVSKAFQWVRAPPHKIGGWSGNPLARSGKVAKSISRNFATFFQIWRKNLFLSQLGQKPSKRDGFWRKMRPRGWDFTPPKFMASAPSSRQIWKSREINFATF